MMWTIIGSVAAILGVILLLIGASRGNATNTAEHEHLGEQIKATNDDVRRVITGVNTISTSVSDRFSVVDSEIEELRTETQAGFRALSEQISRISPEDPPETAQD